MNYEEKYKQALERAKHYTWYSTNRSDTAEPIKNAVEAIFPELRESENERIRKSLIKGFQHYDKECKWGEFTTTEILSWLEKQGEKTIPKNIDDAALQYVDTCAVDGKFTHGNITEPCWNNHSMMAAYKAGWLEKQDEKPSWSEEDKKMLDSIIDCLDGTGLLDFDQIDWLKTLKDRVQPKKDWSEEDEKTWKELIEEVKDQLDSIPWPEYRNKEDYKVEKQLNKWLNWLKSIKPNHWKPSEEQMQALETAMRCRTMPWEQLGTLYNDLKKL